MKYIKLLLLTIFLATDLFAQALPIRNEGGAALRDIQSNLTVGKNFAVNRNGAAYVTLSSAVGGDANAGKQPIRDEDSAFAASDALMMSGAVNNNALSNFNTTSGDVTPFAVGNIGNLYTSLYRDSAIGGSSPIRAEDSAFGDGETGIVSLGIAVSAISQGVGASGDVAPPSMDLGNRTVTTNAPAGEMWSNCSASNTGTSDVAIKAAVASNRIYVTSISCFNTAAVSSSMIFKSAAASIYVGGIGNSTLQGVAYWEHSLPTPLRLNNNEAFNFAMGTTATATTCCAAGYISTI